VAEPFLSEIRIMSFNFAPKGWAFCNGQFLPINQNQALFALLGTTYGGNGQTTFALPDFRGRVPIHFGGAHNLGEAAGTRAATISIQQMPTHTHVLGASTAAGNAALPAGNVLADTPSQVYAPPTSGLTALTPQSVTNTGGSQPHENMQPYLTLSFCIALQGIFPSRN
jgi:microcystin-dependent protein